MSKKVEESERQRREYGARGERTQKPFTFRVDNEISEWLESKPNKGRYLNDLVRADMDAHG